jgi:hypothetical protein
VKQKIIKHVDVHLDEDLDKDLDKDLHLLNEPLA